MSVSELTYPLMKTLTTNTSKQIFEVINQNGGTITDSFFDTLTSVFLIDGCKLLIN